MRDLEFRKRFGPVAEPDIAAVEARVGARLPEALRRYLLGDGGGADPRVCWFPVPSNDFYRGYNREGWAHVHAFKRFAAGKAHDLASEVEAVYPPGNPAESISHLPVCGDGGDLVLVALRGASCGSVWWGSRDAFREAGIVEGETLCPVAGDFTAFLKTLRPEDELPADARKALLG